MRLARTRTKGQPACGSVNDLQQGLVRRGASLHLHDAAGLVGRFWLDLRGALRCWRIGTTAA